MKCMHVGTVCARIYKCIWSEVPAAVSNYYPVVVNSMAGENGPVPALFTAAIFNWYFVPGVKCCSWYDTLVGCAVCSVLNTPLLRFSTEIE